LAVLIEHQVDNLAWKALGRQEVKMKQDDEPKVWVTVIKLLIGAVVLIGGVGLALWFAAQGPVHSPALEQAKEEARATAPSKSSSGSSWGIATDSPIRNKR
jgi:cytoskeletal protein RodZ